MKFYSWNLKLRGNNIYELQSLKVATVYKLNSFICKIALANHFWVDFCKKYTFTFDVETHCHEIQKIGYSIRPNLCVWNFKSQSNSFLPKFFNMTFKYFKLLIIVIYKKIYVVFKYINCISENLKLLCPNSQSKFESLNFEILIVPHKLRQKKYFFYWLLVFQLQVPKLAIF